MKGRKPKPKANAKKAPPKLIPSLPLIGEAQREWDRIIKLLGERRILSESDLASLFIYATSYGEYVDATKQIQEFGAVVMSSSGAAVRSPWCTIAKQAFDRIRPLLSEFGMTPSARARLKLDEPSDDDDDDILG